MSAGQFPKRQPSHRIYDRGIEHLRERIEHPIRRQVERQVKDSLRYRPHGWNAPEVINQIWAAIDSPQEGNKER